MKKKIITCITIIALLCMSGISVFAAANKTFYLPEQQIWTASVLENRTGAYEYVQVGCDSVYPTSGSDNFRKIQARIRNGQSVLIMNDSYKVITEGTGLQPLYIKSGYLNTVTVHFSFRGNSSSAAYAVVDYYAK